MKRLYLWQHLFFFLFLFLFLLIPLIIKAAYGMGIAVSPDRLVFDLDSSIEREFAVYNPNDFYIEYSFSAKNNKNLFEFIPGKIRVSPDSYEKIRVRLKKGTKVKNYGDVFYIMENSDSNLKTSVAIKVYINKKKRDGKELFVMSLVLFGGVLAYYRKRGG